MSTQTQVRDQRSQGASEQVMILRNAGDPSRLRRFAKEHPGTTLLAAASASALLSGEFALGALVGVGATLLVSKHRAAKVRHDVRAWTRYLMRTMKTSHP